MKIPSLENQLKKIERKLQPKIESALTKEVSQTVKDVMVENLVTETYDTYTPTSYIRSYDQGGLADDSNIQIYIINGHILKVENIRKDEETGRLVAPIVEYGKGYWTTWLGKEIGPRPFVAGTREDLASGKASESLKKGLKRQGLNIE